VTPLENLTVLTPAGTTVEVQDGAGQIYCQAPSAGHVSFQAGGAWVNNTCCCATPVEPRLPA